MDNSDNTETAGPSVELFPSPIRKNKRGKVSILQHILRGNR